MIENIRADEVLQNYLADECCENDVCVTFHEDISRENYIIIKVDDYYNSLNIEQRPPSLDCLIIRKCLSTGYGLTLVELKNIKSSDGFTVENMKAKFEICLSDFMQKRFKILLDKDYKHIELFFVSNIEIYKRDLGLKLEALSSVKFKYRSKTLMIKPKMPHPTITSCH